MDRLLIIDDSEEIRKQLKWGFAAEYTLLLAAGADEALELFRKHRPKVVLLDLGLPPDPEGTIEGFRCLRGLLDAAPFTKVIVVTGNDGSDSALRAVQNGAYDHLQKPLDLAELKVIVRRALHLHAIEEENRKLRQALDRKSGPLTGIIGQCPAMVQVFSTIRKVATSGVPVLVHGEGGTGKELVARAIHGASPRREKEFVAINCAAVPGDLLEAELFGHEKSAHNHGHGSEGKVEHAQGGTLFLDEIGELPAQLQLKVLRFLQLRTIQRVNGQEELAVDARIIAATNRELSEEVRSGRFREDLYYRIGVVTIALPPLRERKEDITVLAALFLIRFAEEFRKRIKGFSAAAMEQMESYAWPGNVRELENKVQRAVILSEGPLVEPQDMGFPHQAAAPVTVPPAATLKDARDRIERQMVIQAMDRRRGNIAQAAEDLGISRPTFYDIMKKHGLFHMTH